MFINQCIQYFLDCVTRKFASFSPRASRAEYWTYLFVYVVLSLLLFAVGSLLGLHSSGEKLMGFFTYLTLGGTVLNKLFSLVLLVPSVAVAVRRLHDVDKSGWFLILAFIPIIHFYLLYLLCKDGTPGYNCFGDDPKGR